MSLTKTFFFIFRIKDQAFNGKVTFILLLLLLIIEEMLGEKPKNPDLETSNNTYNHF